MKLIAGLGNPGPRYERTRHNVGFEALDKLAERWRIDVSSFERNYEALLGDGQVRDERVLLLKPQTFMNLSGKSVRAVQRFYKIPLENILVMIDDMNLPVGQVRLRGEGSAGGQKGLDHVMLLLGSQAVPRLRIGIGGVASVFKSQHALSRFAPDEREAIDEALETAVDAAACWLQQGMETAMNRYNRKASKKKRDAASRESDEAGEGEQR